MAHNNGIITAPVNVMADVGYVLGTGSGDIGVNCKSFNINKWAKYKPVEHNSPGITTDANRKSALQGLNIPVYTSAATLTAALRTGITAGSHWTRVNPSTFFRVLDFDGYVHGNHVEPEWGNQGVQSAQALNFPFAGRLWTTDDLIRPFSLMSLATIEPYDGERTPTGLLYPSDWDGSALSFPDWYFGVLCVPTTIPASGNADLWIITSDTPIGDYDDGDSMLTNVPFTQGETSAPLGLGSYQLYPIMCSRRTWDGQGTPHFQNFKNSWSGEGGGPGKLVLVDGFRLPVTLVASGGELEITFSVSNGNVNMSIHNDTRLAITFDGNQMFGYLVTDYVAGRRTDIEEVEDAAGDWIDNATEYVLGVKNDNNVLIGRYLDMIGYFREANNNSSVIPANGTVTFSVPIGASTDGYNKPYNGDSELFFCYKFHVQGSNPERHYDELEQ